jgi:hypothetical protein
VGGRWDDEGESRRGEALVDAWASRARWLVNGRTAGLGDFDFGDAILLGMVVPSAF